MKQAQESAARYQNGTPLSIVDGVPVIVKGKRFPSSILNVYVCCGKNAQISSVLFCLSPPSFVCSHVIKRVSTINLWLFFSVW